MKINLTLEQAVDVISQLPSEMLNLEARHKEELLAYQITVDNLRDVQSLAE